MTNPTHKKTHEQFVNEVPKELACIVRRTAQAILDGEFDPTSVIRDFMVSNDRWTLPEGNVQQSVKMKKSKPKSTDEDEDEDDEDEDEDDSDEDGDFDLSSDPDLEFDDDDSGFDPKDELGFDPDKI